MELTERKAKKVFLKESFTVDLFHVVPDGPDEAIRYHVGLSAEGSIQEFPDFRVGFTDSLISAVVAFYPDHGDGFALEPETIEHPEGMTRREAIAVIKAIFEESGRGAAVDEDWVWKPINLDDYLAKIFPWPRYAQIAELLQQSIRRTNAQVLEKKE
jgi:hypothetical protein